MLELSSLALRQHSNDPMEVHHCTGSKQVLCVTLYEAILFSITCIVCYTFPWKI